MSLPVPDLGDRTFEELFSEVHALIPRYAPEWTEHNFSDPGITVLDLLAWLAEMQHYYLNQVSDSTLLKFLDLLGTEPRPATAAEVDITFNPKPTLMGPTPTPGETRLLGRDPATSEEFYFETEADFVVHPVKLGSLTSGTTTGEFDQTPYAQADGIHFFPFGETPASGDRFFIGIEPLVADWWSEDSADRASRRFHLNLYLFEADLPSRVPSEDGFVPPASLVWEYYTASGWRSIDVIDETVSFTRDGRVLFEGLRGWKAAVARTVGSSSTLPTELFWLRATLKTAAYDIAPRLDTVLLNTQRARHRRTIYGERHAGTGLPCQVVELNDSPVLHGTLQLQVDGEKWTIVADLDASGPEDSHVVVDWVHGQLRFGDGVHGRIPDQGTDNILVETYAQGGGESGNIRSGFITSFAGESIDGIQPTNRFDAVGGALTESIDEALDRVRREKKAPTRAVTVDDIVTLARQTPGVRLRRSHVLSSFQPLYCNLRMPGALTVVVVPYTIDSSTRLPGPSDAFRENIRRHLAMRVPVTTDVHVVGPTFVEVGVRVEVVSEPRTGRASLQTAIKSSIDAFLDPLTGGDDGDGWEFGRPVHYSDLVAIVGRVTGVESVTKLELIADQKYLRSDRVELPKTGLAYSGEHSITAVLSVAS